MLTRASGAVLGVVGLTALLAGAMLAVLVGPRGEWSASTTLAGGTSAVVVEPRLASVLGPRVQVRVETADGSDVFVGRARSDDAGAWVRGVARSVVTDVRAGGALVVEQLPGGPSPGAPADVDLWQQQAAPARDGVSSLTWRPAPGARSVVVAGPDGRVLPALDLTVVWRDAGWRTIPLLLVGCGAALLGAGLLLGRRGRRRPAGVGP